MADKHMMSCEQCKFLEEDVCRQWYHFHAESDIDDYEYFSPKKDFWCHMFEQRKEVIRPILPFFWYSERIMANDSISLINFMNEYAFAFSGNKELAKELCDWLNSLWAKKEG